MSKPDVSQKIPADTVHWYQTETFTHERTPQELASTLAPSPAAVKSIK